MPCKRVELPDGGSAIVCSRGKRTASPRPDLNGIYQAAAAYRRRPTIYVDMDGVLADFVGGVLRLSESELRPEDVTDYDLYSVLGVSVAEFWKRIDQRGALWWAELDPYPWAAYLWQMAREAGDAYVLSTPSQSPSSSSGKVMWIDRHLPQRDRRRYILAPDKTPLARRGAILIDDRPANCESWRRRGGRVIPFPQPWNNWCGSAADVIEQLRAVADEVAEER